MPRCCRDRNKYDANNNQMDYRREENHAVDVAVIAAVAVAKKRPGCHFAASGGSVIIPSLSTPALRTSDMTSTTNP